MKKRQGRAPQARAPGDGGRRCGTPPRSFQSAMHQLTFNNHRKNLVGRNRITNCNVFLVVSFFCDDLWFSKSGGKDNTTSGGQLLSMWGILRAGAVLRRTGTHTGPPDASPKRSAGHEGREPPARGERQNYQVERTAGHHRTRPPLAGAERRAAAAGREGAAGRDDNSPAADGP